jgi:cytochrome P450
LHDPEAYPEPERFKPERFLNPDNTLNPSVRDPRIAAFGFGRRICPGRYFAEATQFATIATVLATMDVVRAKNIDGQEIIPDVDVHSATFCYPKPFNWAARSRSARSITLLESALGIDS